MCFRNGIFFVILLAGLPGCQSNNKPQSLPAPEKPKERAVMKTDNLQKIYLDEMAAALSSPAQQKTTLGITGNLPSGAYKFDHTQVEIKDHVIEVTPWAQYDPNVMAIQMLIPFADSVEVGPLPPGEYEIRFNARSGVQTAKLEVK